MATPRHAAANNQILTLLTFQRFNQNYPMHRPTLSLIGALLLLLPRAHAALQAGIATVDITPPIG